MKNLITTGLLLLVLTSLTGCKSVVTEQYFGQPIAAEQAQQLEGVWRFEKDVLHVKHTDGGQLIAAGLEWKDDAFKINELKLLITEHANARLLFAVHEDVDDHGDDQEQGDDNEDADDDDAEREWLVCGVLTRSDRDVAVLAAPNFDRFKQAIEAGQLQGEVEDDGNTLEIESDKQTLEALITEDNLHEFFDMTNPVVISRIGDL